MERIAKFHKVSYEQFEGDWKDTFGLTDAERSNVFTKDCVCQPEPLPVLRVMIFIHQWH